MIKVTNVEKPFSFKLRDLIGYEPATVEKGVKARAEEDLMTNAFESLKERKKIVLKRKVPKGVPFFEKFTEEHLSKFGPVKERQIFSTERHVYETPFMYDNVDVGNYLEIDPTKGIELIADQGFITISEDKPILGVTVVGSGCKAGGYNICEWWNEGEHIDNMKNQLVKRQRIDNLNGAHPQIYLQLLMGTFPGLTYKDVAGDEIKNAVDCLKKQSDGYYGGIHMGFYENTAYFRVGPPYPGKITIRGGCKDTEEPWTATSRYPGEYAFRVIETTVINVKKQ